MGEEAILACTKDNLQVGLDATLVSERAPASRTKLQVDYDSVRFLCNLQTHICLPASYIITPASTKMSTKLEVEWVVSTRVLFHNLNVLSELSAQEPVMEHE